MIAILVIQCDAVDSALHFNSPERKIMASDKKIVTVTENIEHKTVLFYAANSLERIVHCVSKPVFLNGSVRGSTMFCKDN